MGSERDVGAMGEAAFESMCAAVGLIANKAFRDRSGWDFLVEYPIQHTDSVTVDEREYPVECRVQVKSTDSKPGKRAIKLSNLERFAKAPMPAFVLFLEFEGNENPVNGYLVHIDEKLVARVLKKLREIDTTEARTSIHKVSLSITYNESHKLPFVNGLKLKECIDTYVSAGMYLYTKEKLELIKNVGYETSKGSITFSFLEDDGLHAVVDNMLGYSDTVAIDRVNMIPERFGIPSSRQNNEVFNGKFNFNLKSSISGRIEISPKQFGQPLILKCEVFTSPLFGPGMEAFEVIRLKSDLIDWRISVKNGEARFSVSLDGNRSIYDWNRSMSFVSALVGNGEYSEVRLICDGHPELTLPRPKDAEIRNQFGELGINARAALLLANEFGFDAESTLCDLEILEGNSGLIEFLVYIARPGSITNITLKFVSGVDSDLAITTLESRRSQPICVLLYQYVDFISLRVGAIFTAKGLVSENEGVYAVNDADIDVHSKVVITESTTDPNSLVASLIDSTMKDMQESGFVVLNQAIVSHERSEN